MISHYVKAKYHDFTFFRISPDTMQKRAWEKALKSLCISCVEFRCICNAKVAMLKSELFRFLSPRISIVICFSSLFNFCVVYRERNVFSLTHQPEKIT